MLQSMLFQLAPRQLKNNWTTVSRNSFLVYQAEYNCYMNYTCTCPEYNIYGKEYEYIIKDYIIYETIIKQQGKYVKWSFVIYKPVTIKKKSCNKLEKSEPTML